MKVTVVFTPFGCVHRLQVQVHTIHVVLKRREEASAVSCDLSLNNHGVSDLPFSASLLHWWKQKLADSDTTNVAECWWRDFWCFYSCQVWEVLLLSLIFEIIHSPLALDSNLWLQYHPCWPPRTRWLLWLWISLVLSCESQHCWGL